MSHNKINLLNSYSKLDELNELQIANRRELLKEITNLFSNNYLILKLSEKDNLSDLIEKKYASSLLQYDLTKSLPVIEWSHTVLRGSKNMKSGFKIEGIFSNSPYFFLLNSNGDEVVFYLLRRMLNTTNYENSNLLKPRYVEEISRTFELEIFKSQNFEDIRSFVLYKTNLEIDFFDDLLNIFSQTMSLYLSSFERIENLIEKLYVSERKDKQQKQLETLGEYKFLKELNFSFKTYEKDKMYMKISQILKISEYALDERELEILKFRYSLDLNTQLIKKIVSLEEVAKNYSLTRERIRQIESQALTKLKILIKNQLHEENKIENIKKFCESYKTDYKNNTDGLRKLYKYFVGEEIYFKGQLTLYGVDWLSKTISKLGLRDIVAKKYINYIFDQEQNKNELNNIENTLTQSIDVLNLSSDSKNTLINNGLYNINLLINFGKSNLYNLKGIKPESVTEINSELNSYIRHLSNNPINKKLNIDSFNFSLRIINVFDQQEITSIDDLLKLSEDDLYKFPNLGKGSINEIINKLGQEGINLSN